MRIISGFLKGRKIDYLKNLTTRPLKDSVRENIFNILKHSKKLKIDIENSVVFDLYSGVGSFGIECVSRGAKLVIFFEQNDLALKTIKKNITNLSVTDKVNIISGKIEETLEKNYDKKFNILFCDPPYSDDNFIENLKLIKKRNLYKLNYIIVIHREKQKKDNFNNLIKIIVEKKYGKSKIIFGRFISDTD